MHLKRSYGLHPQYKATHPKEAFVLCGLFFLFVCLFQGLRKRELLKELLPVIGQNLRFQRLFTEYQEQLDILRDK